MSMIIRLSTFITIVIAAIFLPCIDCLQCYKCGCFRNPGEASCNNESQLNCEIQYVENDYCYILQSPVELEFGHNSNSDLIFLKSSHYVRITEEFTYDKTKAVWLQPQVTQVSYGCDWNLCNTQQILDLLPSSFSFNVSTDTLTNLLIRDPQETLTTCVSCVACVNDSSKANCTSTNCNGTCLIDDHIDDPQFNVGGCSVSFTSQCTEGVINTSVRISGNYFIDDKTFDVTEIDIDCRKTDCNSIDTAQAIKTNVTHLANVANQLFFRPTPGGTSPPTPESLPCYTCNCRHDIGDLTCFSPNCSIEYRNGSYCDISRNFKDFVGIEVINLGHVPRNVQRYRQYILVEETLTLFRNLTWQPSTIDRITFVCDWPLCNDPRIIDKLLTSIQFSVDPSQIANLVQGSNETFTCLDCHICSNNTNDIENCSFVNCGSGGHCFIDQLIDDPQSNDCEYAFTAECEPTASESSITIIATYNIDVGDLDIDEVDLYCSLDNCNSPSTIEKLIPLIRKDIRLDAAFFFRPAESSTSTTTTTTATSTVYTSSTSATNPSSTSSTSATNPSSTSATNPSSTSSTSATNPSSTSATNPGSTISTTTPGSGASTMCIVSFSICLLLLPLRQAIV